MVYAMEYGDTAQTNGATGINITTNKPSVGDIYYHRWSWIFMPTVGRGYLSPTHFSAEMSPPHCGTSLPPRVVQDECPARVFDGDKYPRRTACWSGYFIPTVGRGYLSPTHFSGEMSPPHCGTSLPPRLLQDECLARVFVPINIGTNKP